MVCCLFRDHIYAVDMDTVNSDEIFFSKVSITVPVSWRGLPTVCPVRDSMLPTSPLSWGSSQLHSRITI